MNNQHAGLSQTLAEQHITALQQQAVHQRLLRAVRRPWRRCRSSTRRWWQLLDRQAAPRTT